MNTEKSFKDLLNNVPIGVIIHEDFTIIYFNKTIEKFLHMNTSSPNMSLNIFDYIHPDSWNIVRERISLLQDHKTSDTFFNIKILSANNAILHMKIKSIPVNYLGKEAIATIIIPSKYNKKSKSLSDYSKQHDQLTGLGNRSLLENIVHNTIKSYKINMANFALMLVDIDNFKFINETYGRQIGDALLKIVADRINTVFISKDNIFRFAGDQFIILVDNLTKESQLFASKKSSSSLFSTPSATISIFKL